MATVQGLSDSFLNFDPNFDLEAIEQEQDVMKEYAYLCDVEF